MATVGVKGLIANIVGVQCCWICLFPWCGSVFFAMVTQWRLSAVVPPTNTYFLRGVYTI